MTGERPEDLPSMRWTKDKTSYTWNMVNKPKIIAAIHDYMTMGKLGYHHLAGIVMEKPWYVPGPQDPPNYQFMYRLSKEYLEFTKTIEIPDKEEIILENLVKYIASLAKRDPAYISRLNGIMFQIIKDGDRGQVHSTDNARELNFIAAWWNTLDGRERCHREFEFVCKFLIDRYANEPFYTKSIDWILNWITSHKTEFIYTDDMNPKTWYGNCGVGLIDNLCMGGQG